MATSIPKQVTEAADMATALHTKMFGGDTEMPADANEVNAGTPADKDPATPAALDGDTNAADSTSVKETVTEPIDWEAKFNEKNTEHETLTQTHKTLKGKYDKEVPANASRADLLQNELTAFKKQVFDRLGNPDASQSQTSQEPSAEDTALANKAEKFREEYGDEYVDNLRSFILQEMSPILRESVKPVEEKVTNVQEAQNVVAQETYISAVDENITDKGKDLWKDDWTVENNNPEFEAWLAQPDPSGVYTNGELANVFNENGDGVRFAKLISSFYGEGDAAPAVVEEPAAVTPEPTPEKKTEGQEHMIAPDTSSTTTPETTNDKTVWTEASMAEFYEKDRKGKYSKEVSAKMWTDLLSALAEGRIQKGQAIAV